MAKYSGLMPEMISSSGLWGHVCVHAHQMNWTVNRAQIGARTLENESTQKQRLYIIFRFTTIITRFTYCCHQHHFLFTQQKQCTLPLEPQTADGANYQQAGQRLTIFSVTQILFSCYLLATILHQLHGKETVFFVVH